jgi:hypoxanthine phosphoribosyltransferase
MLDERARLCPAHARGDTIARVSGGERKSPELRELFAARAVEERIAAVAEEIARALGGGAAPILVVIAEGARRFASALRTRLAALGVCADETVVRARRSAGLELRPVELGELDPAALAGRDVVVVDDIADEGRTLEAVCARVRAAAPRSLRTAVLVSKLSRRRVALPLDHVGFEVARGWVVGFGMDLDGALRELDWIGVVEGSEERE